MCKSWLLSWQIALNHIIYADDLCCFSPSLDGLQVLLNVCSNYTVKHDITFNCSKSVGVLFLSKYLSLSNVPKFFLCKNVVKFKNNVKYLGVFLNNNLKDDDDICRHYLYGKSYQLFQNVPVQNVPIKNILFNYHCTSFYASHGLNILWSKNPAIGGTFLCLLMPVPSPDKWGELRQEGHPA